MNNIYIYIYIYKENYKKKKKIVRERSDHEKRSLALLIFI